MPLQVKLGHWFYISQNWFWEFKKAVESIVNIFVFFIKISCQSKESPLSRQSPMIFKCFSNVFFVWIIVWSPRFIIKFIVVIIYFIKNIKCFIKSTVFLSIVFSVFSNRIITGCGLVLLPWLSTLWDSVVVSILFTSVFC